MVTTNTNERDNARERRAGERCVRSHLWRMEQARERVQESRVAFYSEKWGEVRDYTSRGYIEARKRAASSPSNSVLSLVLFLSCLYTGTAVFIRARGHLPRNFSLLSRRGLIYLCSCWLRTWKNFKGRYSTGAFQRSCIICATMVISFFAGKWLVMEARCES